MRQAAVPVALSLLSLPAGTIAELWVRALNDDAEAHDDATQAHFEHDFVTAFDEARVELAKRFGTPTRVGENNNADMPVSGILRFAIWSVDEKKLWLAAAHEDRESPFVLLLGLVP